MLSRMLNLVFLILISGVFWFFSDVSPHALNIFYSALAFTGCYFVFNIVLEDVFSKGIKDEKMKYSFRKTVSILSWVVFFILFIRIWIVNPQALLVAYGLIGAGIAISLQDFFKNFVGGVIIFTKGPYSVGDRIEVNGEFGDVIDVSLMYTTIMEMREWVSGDQATGRICTIPNGFILFHVVNNYTRDHNFIWDEINLPITYDSDWKLAIEKIIDVVKKETKNFSERAEREILGIKERYFLSKRDVQPNVFLNMTDNWIMLNIRYVVDVRSRRVLNSRLTQLILEEIQKNKKIKIASSTLAIIGYPKVKGGRHG